MRFRQHLLVGSVALIITTLAVAPSYAQIRLSDPHMAANSEVIVTGTVVDVRSAWDSEVDTIYTYITLQVDEVIKGRLIGSRIVIKELGGVVGNLGLAVGDSAVYSPGEEVMTFLARRPRDDTWQTNGDWQGKWSIERSAKNPRGYGGAELLCRHGRR